MKYIISRVSIFFSLTICIACGEASTKEKNDIDSLKINQIQVLGTHNSYAQPVDSNVLAFADPIFDKMMEEMSSRMPAEKMEVYKEYHPNTVKISEGLKYDHPPFDVQLDSGLRSLEIDVYYDPTGNRFTDPAMYRALREKGITDLAPYKTEGLDQPGFKVMHVADFDFRTHYVTLKEALQALRSWSDKNSDHAPVFIMIEAKDQGIPLLPGAAEILAFTEKAFDELDEEIVSVMGKEKLITPDDVRGSYTSMREAVLAGNWPTVGSARGKFIFLLLPSAGGIELSSDYVKGRPNLENRIMFIQSKPEDPFAAFILLDNAIVRQKEIQQLVQQGYLVRTRSDIETYEAKVNDYTRARAAFESGAQVISTDFFQQGNTYGTTYRVQLPGGGEARVNPVNGKKQ